MKRKYAVYITLFVLMISFSILAFSRYTFSKNNIDKPKTYPKKRIVYNTNYDSYLRKLIGQMFFVSIPNTIPSKSLMNFLTTYHIGGVILFSSNIKSPNQVKTLTHFIQKASKQDDGLKLFIAIDQEGGLVDRLSKFLVYPYNLSQASLGVLYKNDPKRVEDIDYKIGCLMKELGINLNFAPVVDVAYNKNGFIYKQQRSFSNNPYIVSKLSQAAIKGYSRAGIITCLKHFAGLGRATKDPQYTPPIINAGFKTLYNTDWLPYETAIRNNDAYMIMVSHGIYPLLGSDKPASISKKIISILRNKLHYNGVIITDDLTMGALNKYGGITQRVLDAIKAGDDIVLICGNENQVIKAYNAVLNAVKTGQIPVSRIEQSFRRIEILKRSLISN